MLAHFLANEISLGLCQDFGWVYKILRLSNITADDR